MISWIFETLARVRAFCFKRQLDQQLEEEVATHIELATEENIRRGMERGAARREALLRLGSIDGIRELHREVRGLPLLDGLVQDLRYGARQLAQAPLFTVVTTLMLAFAIGGVSAVFTQVNAVFLKPLPVKHPGELRLLAWMSVRPNSNPTAIRTDFPYLAYLGIRDRVNSVADLACWQPADLNSSDAGRLRAQFVSGNYFGTLGINPLVGRTLTSGDDTPTATVAVLSYQTWMRAFGGDHSVVNRSLDIGGRSFRIVGVMPRGFFGLDPMTSSDIIAPIETLSLVPASQALLYRLPTNRQRFSCQIVGRVMPASSDEQVRTEIETILREAMPNELPHLLLTPAAQGLDTVRRATSRPLLLLMIIVSVILLIACANLAGLLIARGRFRQKEIATRLAVGASRARLVRQLLTESVLLSLIGGTIGIALAYVFHRLMPGTIGAFVAAPLRTMGDLGLEAVPDLRALGFTIALTVTTILMFGLVPAFRNTRVNLLAVMKQRSSDSFEPKRGLGGRALVGVQVALSMSLLLGAGLFIRTLINLQSEPLGIQSKGLLFFRADPTLSRYTGSRVLDFFENSVQRLERVPGVISASGSGFAPLGASPVSSVCIPGDVPQDPNALAININTVAPRFFETWGMPVLHGRDIERRDREDSPLVAVINEAFAKRFYQGRNPVGQVLSMPACRPGIPQRTVIGVVADSKANVREAPRPTVYLPYRQYGTGGPIASPMGFVLRAADPAALIPTIRQVMAELDSHVPIFEVATAQAIRDRLITQERLLTFLLSFFGLVALLLSCFGIYGMLAYTVSQRTSEIGVRMVLGARSADIIRIAIRESLTPVLAGLVIGLGSGLALSRWVESLLYGVSKWDAVAIVGAVALFTLTAAIAALLPAVRALRIDVMSALRQE